jgi:hypothetical protein
MPRQKASGYPRQNLAELELVIAMMASVSTLML